MFTRYLTAFSLTAIAALTLAACDGGSMMQSGQDSTQCTTQSQENWMEKEAFRERLEKDGYEINEFNVTNGDCYEISGYNAQQERVEIQFNPVDGSIIKQDVD